MRKLVWFTVGFAAACAVAAYWLRGNVLLFLCIAAAVCAMAVIFLKPKLCKIIGFVMLGLAIGFCWNWRYQLDHLSNAITLDGKTQLITVTATDYSYETDYGVAVDGELSVGEDTYRVKLYVYDAVSLKPGDQIRSECTFRYTAQGAASDPTYHQGKGIFVLAYSSDEYELIESTQQEARFFPAYLRKKITNLLDRTFPEDVLGFARALLLGDTSLMSYDNTTAFTVSGISHVIAVSGMHVSILFSVVFVLFMKQKHLTAIFGIPILLLFTAVAGFTPSILRACVMQILVIIAMLTQKEYDPPTALGISVLVILSVNPLTITSAGFQLSVACMIGMFAFSGRMSRYLLSCRWAAAAKAKHIGGRLLLAVINSVSISLSVWVVTAPLCVLHFGSISIVGILTNLLTVWLVSYIFYGIVIGCILGAVWLPLGVGIAWVIAFPMRLVQWIAMGLSRVPYAAVYTDNIYILMWVVLCYVLLLLFVFLKYKRPVLMLLCLTMSLVISCVAGVITERSVDNRISILDVGQGQCILLKHNGGYYLVDCGGSNSYDAADIAAEYLLSRGIHRLDGIIITHYKKDHAGAADMLMSRVDTQCLYLPDILPDDHTRQQLCRHSDKIVWVNQTLTLTDADITIFFDRDESSEYERGICVLFQPDNYDILILGDQNSTGEKALMKQLDLPELELLVAAEHGSANATCYEFLQQTVPRTTVISVGDNSYGQPTADTLERLDKIGSKVYRTDLNGTIEFGW